MRILTFVAGMMVATTALAGSGTHVAGCSAHEAIASLLKREGMTYFSVGPVVFHSATMVADRVTAEVTYRNVEPVQRELFILRRESLGGIDCFYAERPPVKQQPSVVQRREDGGEESGSTGMR